jgi:hypothetical protein
MKKTFLRRERSAKHEVYFNKPGENPGCKHRFPPAGT